MKNGILIPITSFVVVLAYFTLDVSINNREVALMNEYKAQEKIIEATHDAMWKILQQKAGVTKEYSTQFDSVYSHIMSSRYQDGDKAVLNWIRESNPEFSDALYRDLSISIEVQRSRFLGSQKKIIDVEREYNNLIRKIPGKWFLSGKPELSYEPISSRKTKNVIHERQDDDVDLY